MTPQTDALRAAVIVLVFACALTAALLLAHILGREAVTGLIIGGGLGGLIQWRSRVRKGSHAGGGGRS